MYSPHTGHNTLPSSSMFHIPFQHHIIILDTFYRAHIRLCSRVWISFSKFIFSFVVANHISVSISVPYNVPTNCLFQKLYGFPLVLINRFNLGELFLMRSPILPMVHQLLTICKSAHEKFVHSRRRWFNIRAALLLRFLLGILYHVFLTFAYCFRIFRPSRRFSF